MGRRVRFFLSRPTLALRLIGLLAAYVASRFMALAFESRPARAFWAATLIPVVVGLVTVAAFTRHLECPAQYRAPAPSPFDTEQLPLRQAGDHFDYQSHFGYQVPLSFFIGEVGGPIERATLTLRARMLRPDGQLHGTEAISVEGILSGAPHPGFLRSDRITRNISGDNDFFLRALTACCNQQWGELTVDLSQLIAGSTVPVAALLDDGRLDVVIADDTEIASARLEVCVIEHGLTRCHRAWVDPRLGFGSN